MKEKEDVFRLKQKIVELEREIEVLKNNSSLQPRQDILEFDKKIIDILPVGIALYDNNGNLVAANRTLMKIGKGFPGFLENRKNSGFIEAKDYTLNTGEEAEREIHITTETGKDIWLNNRFISFNINGAQNLLVVFNDITELKKEQAERETALLTAKSLKTASEIIEGMMDPIEVTDLQGRIIQVNRAFLELTGYNEQEVIGSMPLQMIDEEEHVRMVKSLSQCLNDGCFRNFEIEIMDKNGKKYPVLINSRVVYDEHGEPMKIISVLHEISDLKKTQEELRRSNHDLEQFAYVASHDLQEPLRMVASYTKLLSDRYKGKLDKNADEFINFAVDGATRMQNFINDLLDYSRISTMGNPPAIIDCNEIIEEIKIDLAVAIKESGVEITHSRLPKILYDRAQLIQLFENLVSNSIKFKGSEKPCIAVSASKCGRKWLFSVKDNGIGIDPAYFEKIFVIFQRLHPRSEYGGTGIGLSICKKIVERHGGNIWVESEVQKGSTFYFTIPAELEAQNGSGSSG